MIKKIIQNNIKIIKLKYLLHDLQIFTPIQLKLNHEVMK